MHEWAHRHVRFPRLPQRSLLVLEALRGHAPVVCPAPCNVTREQVWRMARQIERHCCAVAMSYATSL